MKTERLFVGGVLHCKYRSVPEEWIVVEEPERIKISEQENTDKVIGVDCRVNRYLLMTFQQRLGYDQIHEHKVFVIENMSREDAEQYLHNQKLRLNPGR